MVMFGQNRQVTVVRHAGTPSETRWQAQAGGDFRSTILFHTQVAQTGDDIQCSLFDEPRIVSRVDPGLLQTGVAWWTASIMPRSQWIRLHPEASVVPSPTMPERSDVESAEDVGSVPVDPEKARRAKIRSAWLDERKARHADWTSDADIVINRGPAYNTIQLYRAGAVHSRTLYVRRKLATAFKCDLTDVPE